MKELLLNFLLGTPPAPPPVPVRRATYVKRFVTVYRWVARSKFARVDLAGNENFKLDGPVVIYANHPGFWDPIVCALVCQAVLPDHQVFAPIDENALRTHWYFRGLGFFGVQQNTAKGMRQFLKVGEAIFSSLSRPCLVLTPESRFTDPSHRPIVFRKGLSTLLSRLRDRDIAAFPLALDYRASEGEKPVAWAYLGSRAELSGPSRSSLHQALEVSLEHTLNRNAERIERGVRGTNILEVTV